jgi:hypothetical protein
MIEDKKHTAASPSPQPGISEGLKHTTGSAAHQVSSGSLFLRGQTDNLLEAPPVAACLCCDQASLKHDSTRRAWLHSLSPAWHTCMADQKGPGTPQAVPPNWSAVGAPFGKVTHERPAGGPTCGCLGPAVLKQDYMVLRNHSSGC